MLLKNTMARHEKYRRETRSGSPAEIQAPFIAGGAGGPPGVGWMENQPWDSIQNRGRDQASDRFRGHGTREDTEGIS